MSKAIEAVNLTKVYQVKEGGLLFRRRAKVLRALDGLSFRVNWGEVYGLLGPNGAGKTTAVRILATLLLPDSGKALVAGYDVVEEPEEVRRRIGVMLSVERGFFWKLTARENLKYFGMLYGLDGEELEKRIDHVLELVGLKELGAENRRFEDMSLGMKARLGLARALLKDPQVLILDEPTLGLDPPSSRTIRNLLRDQARRGKAVLLTTHNMHEAETVCDRVGIISRGRIVAEGTPEELKRRVANRVGISMKVAGTDSDVAPLARSLSEALGVSAGVTSNSDGYVILRVVAEPELVGKVISYVINKVIVRGLKVVEWKVEEPTLEDVFIALTGGGERLGEG